ncbi:MAG: hypothetical protein HY275_08575 [Gemmatimonadetes bacterium]|nr:hypothetical protein [Gemmatimonadota bacterium]
MYVKLPGRSMPKRSASKRTKATIGTRMPPSRPASATGKHKFAKSKAAAQSQAMYNPPGYARHSSGLTVPDSVVAPVPASKLRAGIRAARTQIDESLDELVQVLAGPYRIKSIEVQVSFSAEGKFLGFGVGGATSIKLVIEPDATADT